MCETFDIFGHPEIYILILLGHEMVSHIRCHERGGEKDAFSNLCIHFAILTVSPLEFEIWA